LHARGKAKSVDEVYLPDSGSWTFQAARKICPFEVL
jgi:hypothetical protein